jgi:hypothetical protein
VGGGGKDENDNRSWTQMMCILHMYEYGTLKPDEVNLRKVTGKRKNGGDEPNWGTLYTLWKCHIETPCTAIKQ